jgi:hypothetical protein
MHNKHNIFRDGHILQSDKIFLYEPLSCRSPWGTTQTARVGQNFFQRNPGDENASADPDAGDLPFMNSLVDQAPAEAQFLSGFLNSEGQSFGTIQGYHWLQDLQTPSLFI